MEHSRPARPDDLPRLLELSAAARSEQYGERGGVIWAVREATPEPREGELRAALADPERLLQLGFVGDYPVGYGLVRVERLRNGDRLAVVEDIFVEAPFRGVAVGEVIMDAVIDWARGHDCIGIDSLVLPGMRESKNFFERYGLKARALLVHRSLRPEGSGDDAPGVPGPNP